MIQKVPTSLQFWGIGHCLREFTHGICRFPNKSRVPRMVFVDEEHGQSIASRIDGEEVLLAG